jgi:YD repeat-containing protein
MLFFRLRCNLLTYRTRSGSTIVNTFDVLNRLATKTPTGEAVVTCAYDLHGRLLSATTPIVSGNPAMGGFAIGYDTAGRVKSETTPDSKVTQYGLDSNGNLTKLTYPDGYYVTRVLDQLNRLTDIKLNGATALCGISCRCSCRRMPHVTAIGNTSTCFLMHFVESIAECHRRVHKGCCQSSHVFIERKSVSRFGTIAIGKHIAPRQLIICDVDRRSS